MQPKDLQIIGYASNNPRSNKNMLKCFLPTAKKKVLNANNDNVITPFA